MAAVGRRYLRGKHVTASRNCFDDPLIHVAERKPHVAHTSAERIVAHNDIGPNRFEDFILGHDAVSVFSEVTQHVEALWTQLNIPIVRAQAAARAIECKSFKLKSCLSRARHCRLDRNAT